MTTTLDTDFLRAIVLLTAFKPSPMEKAQAALLMMALTCVEVTAYDIPREITNGSRHLAGAAVGALIAQGLLVVERRIKSPDVRAKGRKLDVLRIAKPATAFTWLRQHGYEVPQRAQAAQLALAI